MLSMLQGWSASYLQRVFKIYIPEIVPSIAMATILCLIGSFGVFDELVGMGAFYGNDSVRLFSIILYKFGFGGGAGGQTSSGRLSEAITMSVVVYVPLLIIAIIITRRQRLFEEKWR